MQLKTKACSAISSFVPQDRHTSHRIVRAGIEANRAIDRSLVLKHTGKTRQLNAIHHQNHRSLLAYSVQAMGSSGNESQFGHLLIVYDLAVWPVNMSIHDDDLLIGGDTSDIS